MSVAQKVVETLEAKNLLFTPEEVERVVKGYGLTVEGGVEKLAKEVLVEGVKRSVGVVEAFCDAFKVSLPLDQIEELFWREGSVYVRGPAPLEVHTRRGDGSLIDVLRPTISSPSLELPEKMELHVWPGRVRLRLGYPFQAVRGRAFFKGYNREELERTLEDVKRLAPFLSAMELEDLPQALEKLGTLGMWESRVEGPYVLVRKAWAWVLRRGPVFGDPELDGAVLREDRVALSFPGDVEVAFKVAWHREWDSVGLEDFRIRWGKEVVYFEEDSEEEEWRVRSRSWVGLTEKNPIAELIRSRLEQEVYFYEYEERWSQALSDASPRMRALVRVLAEQDDPLVFLAEGKLNPYVTAELFGDL